MSRAARKTVHSYADAVAAKEASYHAARAEAQRAANADGCDRGLEWNEIFKTWRSFMLPARANRFGYELRVEVVSCEDLSKCPPGHGPHGGPLANGWQS